MYIEDSDMTIPTDLDLGNLDTSANILIPGDVVLPGLEMVVEIDPDNTSGERLNLEEDRLPMTGRTAIDVKRVPPLDLTLVPFFWAEQPEYNAQVAMELEGITVDDDLFRYTRDVLPVETFNLSVHEPVWTAYRPAGLRSLEETNMVFTMEGQRGHYMGIISFGGMAHLPGFVSVAATRPYLIAHELGHNMSLLHAPCNTQDRLDLDYPYDNAEIGQWGFDLLNWTTVSSATPDLMSYCGPPGWISDYNFTKSLHYRANWEQGYRTASIFSSSDGSLLIWGGVGEEGELGLRPAFAVDAQPVLPVERGPYRLEGTDKYGNTLFHLSFSTEEVDHSEGSVFAFIVPLRTDWIGRLDQISLSGPEGFDELNAGGDRYAALLLDQSIGTVRGIFDEWSEPGSPVRARRLELPYTGLEILTSPGIPDIVGTRDSASERSRR